MTIVDFERRYRNEKPYYEYWNGEALQKSSPTWIHGLLQIILGEFLTKAGYLAASEVRLKIDPDLQLIPDVIATRKNIASPYPVSGFEIVAEILSEDDSMSRMLTKCEAYHRWGFEQIYVIDPVARTVFRWMGSRLEEVDRIADFSDVELWSSLDRKLDL